MLNTQHPDLKHSEIKKGEGSWPLVYIRAALGRFILRLAKHPISPSVAKISSECLTGELMDTSDYMYTYTHIYIPIFVYM